MKRDTLSSNRTVLTLDLAVMVFTLSLLALAVVFPDRVEQRPESLRTLLLIAASYPVISYCLFRLKKLLVKTSLRIVLVMTVASVFFDVVAHFQHVWFDGWMDALLISLEHSLIGTESSVFFQRITSPVLTEWMMFAYVIYIPLLPLVAFICYRAGGAKASHDYLFNLTLSNILCFCGFIVFPVAGPLVHYPEMFTVALEGGFFTLCGEWMRSNVHYPGGCLPSVHCCAATIMAVMLYRYARKLFWIALPVILTLYVATVYGRYHYAWDGIAGIVVAFTALQFSPFIADTVSRVFSVIQKFPVLEPVRTHISNEEAL